MNPYWGSNQSGGHHGHHHHHGHHKHHGHHDPTIVVVVNQTGHGNKLNQGFNNNPGINMGTNMGINGMINNMIDNTIPQNNILFNPNQQYVFATALDQNMVLDVSQDAKNNGQLILWKKHGKKNQKFRIVQGYGGYHIINSATNNIITPNNNSDLKGSFLYTNFNQNLQGQAWNFTYATDKKSQKQNNVFYIQNAYGQYLDVCEGKANKGAPVIQYDYNGKKNQRWHLIPV